MLVNDSLVCLEYPEDKLDIIVQVSPEVKAPVKAEIANLIVAGEVIPEQAVLEKECAIIEKVKNNLQIAGELIPKKAIVMPKIR